MFELNMRLQISLFGVHFATDATLQIRCWLLFCFDFWLILRWNHNYLRLHI